jgi:hypothetical protein
MWHIPIPRVLCLVTFGYVAGLLMAGKWFGPVWSLVTVFVVMLSLGFVAYGLDARLADCG